jgi:hypothetical protein
MVLTDPKGRPYVPLAIVEVLYYGAWHRGRLLHVGRKRLTVELVEGYVGRAPYRRPDQVYIVSSPPAPKAT